MLCLQHLPSGLYEDSATSAPVCPPPSRRISDGLTLCVLHSVIAPIGYQAGKEIVSAVTSIFFKHVTLVCRNLLGWSVPDHLAQTLKIVEFKKYSLGGA